MYSKPDTAVIVSQQGVALSEKLHFIKGEMASMETLAEAYNETGNYSKSLALSIEELKLAKDRNDQHQTCAALMGIASAYGFEHKPQLSIQYFHQAKAIATDNHYKRVLLPILNNLSQEFEELNQLDSAMANANECLRLSTAENNTDFTGCALTNLAAVNIKLHHFAAGINYFRTAIPYFKTTDDHEYLCRCYVEMAAYFQQSKQMDSAVYYGNQCMQMALSSHIAEWTLKGSRFLMKYYQATHNTDSVAAYRAIYVAASKGMLNKELQ